MSFTDLPKKKEDHMVEKALKSRTFWGGLIFAIVKFLGSAGILDPGTADGLESAAVALGLFGARNSKK